MCGIVAVISNSKNGFIKSEQAAFYQLLHANTLRGADATGTISIGNEGSFSIMKDNVDGSWFSSSFIDSKSDKALYSMGRAVIGHNRAKTIGQNVAENAHPFVVDDSFAMVHNGTLRNHHLIKATTVDSEALAHLFKEAMDEEDYGKAMQEALWKVEGALACVWYDQKRNQLGFIRNSQRPLSIIKTDKGFLIASEADMAVWIAGRNNIKVEKVVEVPVNTLHLMDLEGGVGTIEEIPMLPKPIPAPSLVKNGGKQEQKAGTKESAIMAVMDTDVEATECGRNQFKRINKYLTGKTIEFRLNDWLERTITGPADGSIFLFGEFTIDDDVCTSGTYAVQCAMNIKDIEMSMKEVDFHYEWSGVVMGCSYNPAKKRTTIHVKQARPVIYLSDSVLH